MVPNLATSYGRLLIAADATHCWYVCGLHLAVGGKQRPRRRQAVRGRDERGPGVSRPVQTVYCYMKMELEPFWWWAEF